FPLAIKLNPVTRKVLVREAVFARQVAASVYFPDQAQTDDTPLITADGSRINPKKIRQNRWLAVSRNLLQRWGGPLQYGDSLYVSGSTEELDGYYQIRDTMNKRLKHTIDILVDRDDNIMGHWKNVRITKYETTLRTENFQPTP